MKRGGKIRLFVLLVVSSLLVPVLFLPAAGEHAMWVCPDCGRDDNTGNFCGTCGHPMPTEEITEPEPEPELTPEPTAKPTPKPTAEPTPEPTAEPTAEPTPEPTAEPEPEPTAEPEPEPDPEHMAASLIGTIKKGNTVAFGHFDQDNDPDNGAEDVEWIVLDVQGNEALLMSKYILNAMPYDRNTSSDLAWAGCSVRSWLNNDFLTTAFTPREQEAILLTSLDNSPAQSAGGKTKWQTTSGEDTEDKIFIPSFHETIEMYFSNDVSRRGAPTDYAIAQGAEASRERSSYGRAVGQWWLRSPSVEKRDHAGAVLYDGSVRHIGREEKGGVRPFLWLNLDTKVSLVITKEKEAVDPNPRRTSGSGSEESGGGGGDAGGSGGGGSGGSGGGGSGDDNTTDSDSLIDWVGY